MSDHLTLAFLYRIFVNVIIKYIQLNYIRRREPQLSPFFFYTPERRDVSSVLLTFFPGI